MRKRMLCKRMLLYKKQCILVHLQLKKCNLLLQIMCFTFSGVGSIFFSLDSTKYTLAGTFPLISNLLCLELDYLMDKVDRENYISITGKHGKSQLSFQQAPKEVNLNFYLLIFCCFLMTRSAINEVVTKRVSVGY